MSILWVFAAPPSQSPGVVEPSSPNFLQTNRSARPSIALFGAVFVVCTPQHLLPPQPTTAATTPPTAQTMSEHGMSRGPHGTPSVCRCWRMLGLAAAGQRSSRVAHTSRRIPGCCLCPCMHADRVVLGPFRVPAVWVVSLRLALPAFCCCLLCNLQITRPLRAPTRVPLSPSPSRLEPSGRTVSWSSRAAPARCGRSQQPVKPANSSSTDSSRQMQPPAALLLQGWLGILDARQQQ